MYYNNIMLWIGFVCSSVVLFLSEAKSLKDDATLESLGVENGGALYFKDLGPQIGWKTVCLHECCNIPKYWFGIHVTL